MSWTNETKPSLATYTNGERPIMETTYLLMEDGYYLLQEDGSKIVLFRSTQWDNEEKNTASWTNETKPV